MAGRRILLTFDYPPLHGGISRLCAILAAGWGADRVRVITRDLPAAGDTPARPPVPTRVMPRRRGLLELRTLLALLGDRRAPALAGIWYPEGLLCWLTRRRYAVLGHALELLPPAQPWRRRLWAALQRRVIAGARVAIANSDYTAGLLRAAAPGARVVAIPLPVDDRRFTPGDRAVARRAVGLPADGRRVLLTIARPAAYKGYDTAFAAIAALEPIERGALRYVVGGSGAYADELRALADRLGIADSIAFPGRLQDDALVDWYRAADCFLLLTHDWSARREVEGFGLVLLEAQACATPVIGARTGGIPSAVVEGDGGWLIGDGDVAALVAHLRRLIADPAGFAAEGARGRARVERACTAAGYVAAVGRALEDAGC